jgi:hypothetical protein
LTSRARHNDDGSASQPWKTPEGRQRLKAEWWRRVGETVIRERRAQRSQGILRRDPDQLVQSFLERFFKSEAVDQVLALGPDYIEQIQDVLVTLAMLYDDSSLPELESPWADAARNPLPAESVRAHAEEMREVAAFFRKMPGLLPSSQDPQMYETVALVLRERAAIQSIVNDAFRAVDDNYQHPEPKLGTPKRYWWTPVAARVARNLQGTPRRWKVLAALAQDFFDATHTPKKIRSLVKDYEKRSSVTR